MAFGPLRPAGRPAGVAGAPCASACELNTLPHLPVLTSANRHTEARWHAYIRHVYREELRGDRDHNDTLDLNTFSWFYLPRTSTEDGQEDHAPATQAVRDLLSTHPCLQVCASGVDARMYEGSPWVGERGPEGPDGVGQVGFFVARPFPLPRSVRDDCTRLEVMHAYTEWAGAEIGISWFFRTVGSGVFLDLTDPPTAGGVAAYTSRAHFAADTGREWPGDFSASVAGYMREAGLAVIVITEATYAQTMDPATRNPRTEILVLQAQAKADEWGKPWGEPRGEDSLPGRSCLSDAPMGFRFKTGVRASIACACTPASTLNCDATPIR